jgi:hypothetical protein
LWIHNTFQALSIEKQIDNGHNEIHLGLSIGTLGENLFRGFLSLGQQSCEIDMIVKGSGKCGLFEDIAKGFFGKSHGIKHQFLFN